MAIFDWTIAPSGYPDGIKNGRATTCNGVGACNSYSPALNMETVLPASGTPGTNSILSILDGRYLYKASGWGALDND